MTSQVVHSLKAIAKRFLVLLVCVVMLFSVTQTNVLAASFHAVTQSIGVLGSAETPDEAISEEALNEKREQRREWQSRVSGTSEINNNNADNETLAERFNLDEITETMKDNLNLDADADAKAAQSYRSSR